MKNWLTTLPATLALTGGFLWFAAAPAFADCFRAWVCIRVDGSLVCSQVWICI